MTYVLITSIGRLMTFSVLECAELYQVVYGGTLISGKIEDTVQEIIYT